MSMRARCWMLTLLLLVPTVSSAQEPGDVGVFMGYPNLGLMWQVSEKVAIRPEIGFSHFSGESDSAATLDASSWNVEFGATALMYLSETDRLRTYVGPQFSYQRSSSDSDAAFFESTTNTYGFAGLFGAQYSLSDRFGVFGELGFGYTRSSADREATGTSTKTNSWSTKTGVGVILYF